MADRDMLENIYIPKNVLKRGKFFGIDYIRWIETIVIDFLVGYGMWTSPFVTKIKIICIIVLCVVLSAFFLRGIKNRSVTQLLIDIIKDNQNRKKYSLGSICDGRKYNQAKQNKFGGESQFERIVNTIKDKFSAFDKKYGNEE